MKRMPLYLISVLLLFVIGGISQLFFAPSISRWPNQIATRVSWEYRQRVVHKQFYTCVEKKTDFARIFFLGEAQDGRTALVLWVATFPKQQPYPERVPPIDRDNISKWNQYRKAEMEGEAILAITECAIDQGWVENMQTYVVLIEKHFSRDDYQYHLSALAGPSVTYRNLDKVLENEAYDVGVYWQEVMMKKFQIGRLFQSDLFSEIGKELPSNLSRFKSIVVHSGRQQQIVDEMPQWWVDKMAEERGVKPQ